MIDWKRAGGCLLIIAACLAIDAAAVAVMFKMLLALSAASMAAASSGAASVASAGYTPVNTLPAPCSAPSRVMTALSGPVSTLQPICARISSSGA